MRTILIFMTAIFLTGYTTRINDKSIHDFKIQALNSDEVIDLAKFKGKKMLIVNVASKCGYTPQYEDLQALYEKYKDELVVIGFPCDQFLGQELDEEQEIATFCKKNYGVTFPLTTIVNVKGKDIHPIYKWLTYESENGKNDYHITWNFNKFLIDEEGRIIDHFPSSIKPLDEKITQHLE